MGSCEPCSAESNNGEPRKVPRKKRTSCRSIGLGELCESDFTHLTELKITIAGQPFPHMLYHFVLTYSNWETGTVCPSESFASLGEGLQNALWELGGVPSLHRTDRMTAAVNNLTEQAEFQKNYQALLRHYGMEGRKIQTGQPNENGDIEQRHYRFQRALDQALLLRGSREFGAVDEYRAFLCKLFDQLNSGRKQRLAEEMERLRPAAQSPAWRVQRERGFASTPAA